MSYLNLFVLCNFNDFIKKELSFWIFSNPYRLKYIHTHSLIFGYFLFILVCTYMYFIKVDKAVFNYWDNANDTMV